MNRISTKFLREEYSSAENNYGITIKESVLLVCGTIEGLFAYSSSATSCGCATWVRKRIKGSEKVLVHSKLRNYQKLVVLYHELGHLRCHRDDCKCYYLNHGYNNGLSEYHAVTFSLKKLRPFPKSLSWAMRDTESWLYSGVHGKEYVWAARKIMKTALWRKCSNV